MCTNKPHVLTTACVHMLSGDNAERQLPRATILDAMRIHPSIHPSMQLFGVNREKKMHTKKMTKELIDYDGRLVVKLGRTAGTVGHGIHLHAWASDMEG